MGRFGMRFARRGRQVRVIGIAVENATVDRAARVLERWAAADPGTPDEALTVKQEIKAIRDAMKQDDQQFFDRYGGRGAAMKRAVALYKTPEANVTEGVSIDDYSTWRAVRFADRDEGGWLYPAPWGRSRPHLSLREGSDWEALTRRRPALPLSLVYSRARRSE